MVFNFKIGDQTILKEIETTQEAIRVALEGKAWRTAVVLKNAYNANAQEKEQLKQYLASHSADIDIERLMTERDYKSLIKEKASKEVLAVEPTEKTELDFIDQAIEKVLEGGGQND